MSFSKKLKAGALQYVLAISVIIALVLFTFISFVFLQQKLQIKNSFYKESVLNVQYGFSLLTNLQLPYNTIKELQVSENKQEKTIFFKRHWGIFDVVTIVSTVKKEHFVKMAILASNNKRDALYLKDNNTPLVLAGNTKIIGNLSLPKQGIKAGNIAGTSFNGNQLYYGIKKTSNKTLPIITNISYLNNLVHSRFITDEMTFFELSDGLKKQQSFTKPTHVYSSNGHLSLINIELKGNIIIHSNSKIIINASANLEDIILIAPEVEIKSNVKGNFQVFSSKSIKVDKNCKLSYPSALVLINKKQIKNNSQKEQILIDIKEKSTIKGIVLFKQKNKKNSMTFNPQIIISKGSSITGEVYCNQNIELLGSVFGSIYTNNFITKQFGSVYVNHIFNGVINNSKLPKQYCGISFNNDKANLKVAKWVY
ncbi:hypothetical protein [Tenacibaculum finnmarkense]|uniref:hypothetical protein n=1 Tax=Tenacibaculum finnmarkense TaxID=2781243 RepID=UPI001EFAB037|nr:hypothetical protein [Tenacibaculum finnmarkense]MCG8208215.1 hypothetical protein [Tenacibaculum finnmarkense genomovar finnmarkense]MCG8724229.1 hypothetical protein [Tenacibaculum finnmarkense]MCG8742523.1 hypothetical protein [Tenacibaculum finnmarkense]MCG8765935.1 hypothetical protein [Tenacibaculum finnmarkense]MCG8778866.1 hypothetical protein [Tenacibaculum finnmarkense]